MTRHRNVYLAFAIVALAIPLLLSGCGSQKDPDSHKDSDDTDDTTSTSKTVTRHSKRSKMTKDTTEEGTSQDNSDVHKAAGVSRESHKTIHTTATSTPPPSTCGATVLTPGAHAGKCPPGSRLKSRSKACPDAGCDAPDVAKHCCEPFIPGTCGATVLTPGARAGKCPLGSQLKSRSKACPDAECWEPDVSAIHCCEPSTCGADFPCDFGDIPLPDGTQCQGECSKTVCCRRGSPTTTVPHTSSTSGLPPLCSETTESKFAMSPRDATACPAGYESITTEEECVRAAQHLGISHNERANITVITNDPRGAHKPYGCFSDKILRIVNGRERLVDTLWLNHNNVAVLEHDNSARICKLACTKSTTSSEKEEKGGGEGRKKEEEINAEKEQEEVHFHIVTAQEEERRQKGVTSDTLANKLYDAGDEGQHLRKHAAPTMLEMMGHPFAITCGAFVMLVATIAFVSVKRRGYSQQSSYSQLSYMVVESHLEADTMEEEYTSLQLARTTDIENALQGEGRVDEARTPHKAAME